MPKAYIIVHGRSNPDFVPPPAYMARFKNVLAAHNGKILVTTYDLQIKEGSPGFTRMIIVEFDSKATAEAAYKQYHKEAVPLFGKLDRELIIVEGVA